MLQNESKFKKCYEDRKEIHNDKNDLIQDCQNLTNFDKESFSYKIELIILSFGMHTLTLIILTSPIWIWFVI